MEFFHQTFYAYILRICNGTFPKYTQTNRWQMNERNGLLEFFGPYIFRFLSNRQLIWLNGTSQTHTHKQTHSERESSQIKSVEFVCYHFGAYLSLSLRIRAATSMLIGTQYALLLLLLLLLTLLILLFGLVLTHCTLVLHNANIINKFFEFCVFVAWDHWTVSRIICITLFPVDSRSIVSAARRLCSIKW